MHNYCELDNQHTKNALKKLSEKCFIQNLRYVNISLIRVRMYDKNRLTDIQEIYNNSELMNKQSRNVSKNFCTRFHPELDLSKS